MSSPKSGTAMPVWVLNGCIRPLPPGPLYEGRQMYDVRRDESIRQSTGKVSRRGAAILRRVSDHQLRLILNSFVEPHFLHASVRSSNFQPNRIGLIRIMTISIPQSGHAQRISHFGWRFRNSHVISFRRSEGNGGREGSPVVVFKGPGCLPGGISVILTWGRAGQEWQAGGLL